MKYLFFDIDGTLLSHEEGISLSTIKGLSESKEKGHKIFICTGRSYAEIPSIMYKFNFDGVIAAAGGYVRVGDKVIYNKVMPEHLVDNIIYELSKTDIAYVLEGVDEVYSHKDAIYSQATRNEKLLAKKKKSNYEHSAYDYRIERLKNIEDYFNERKEISKMTLYGKDIDSYAEFEKFIDKDFYLLKYREYAELIAKGVNKFTGIQKIMKYLNADIDKTVSFGDSLNDYEMIKNCNIGIAVGNASKTVKEIANYVTEDIDNDGIYNALKHFDII